MCSFNTYILILFQELTYSGQRQTKLVVLRRHWLQGDDGIILMLPYGFTTKSDRTTSRTIPSMINLKITDEKRVRVN
jgi:hypothetical protein